MTSNADNVSSWWRHHGYIYNALCHWLIPVYNMECWSGYDIDDQCWFTQKIISSVIEIHAPCKRRRFFFGVSDHSFKLLKSLDGTKSTGYDKIPASLIKAVAEELSLPTMNLVNQTIRNTKFPTVMKLSEISPIFKTSDTVETENNRPINILPCLSKIFERVCHEELYEFFSIFLSAFLAAFRRNYGCHHVLIKFVHDRKVAIDKGLNVGVFPMNLSKAFDCVPHSLLLTKLKYYGLTDQACLLLKSYISDKKQRVEIGISRSAWGPVDHGVPQGSILRKCRKWKL